MSNIIGALVLFTLVSLIQFMYSLFVLNLFSSALRLSGRVCRVGLSSAQRLSVSGMSCQCVLCSLAQLSSAAISVEYAVLVCQRVFANLFSFCSVNVRLKIMWLYWLNR